MHACGSNQLVIEANGGFGLMLEVPSSSGRLISGGASGICSKSWSSTIQLGWLDAVESSAYTMQLLPYHSTHSGVVRKSELSRDLAEMSRLETSANCPNLSCSSHANTNINKEEKQQR